MEKFHYVYPGIGMFFLGIFVVLSTTHRQPQNWQNVIQQPDSFSCGAACLNMILKDRKISCEVRSIEDELKTSNNGASMQSIITCAKRKGVQGLGWHLSLTSLKKIKQSTITCMNSSHFVVVDSLTNNEVFIRDPLQGKLVIPVNDFSSKWDGNALVFY